MNKSIIKSIAKAIVLCVLLGWLVLLSYAMFRIHIEVGLILYEPNKIISFFELSITILATIIVGYQLLKLGYTLDGRC